MKKIKYIQKEDLRELLKYIKEYKNIVFVDNINTIKNEIVENKCNEKLYLGQMEASLNTMKENEHIIQRLSKIYSVYKNLC